MTSPCDPYAPCDENRSMVISTGAPTGYLRAKARYATRSLNVDDASPFVSAVDEGAVVAVGVTGDAGVEEVAASSSALDALPRFGFASRVVRVDGRARQVATSGLIHRFPSNFTMSWKMACPKRPACL